MPGLSLRSVGGRCSWPSARSSRRVLTRHPVSCLPQLQEKEEDRRNQVSGHPLQVRLEIGVVANLAVNLQTIPLAVGYDDAVGFRIEVHRRREAETKFWLQALCPTPGFHHVGVGVDALLAPLGHDLSIADES